MSVWKIKSGFHIASKDSVVK